MKTTAVVKEDGKETTTPETLGLVCNVAIVQHEGVLQTRYFKKVALIKERKLLTVVTATHTSKQKAEVVAGVALLPHSLCNHLALNCCYAVELRGMRRRVSSQAPPPPPPPICVDRTKRDRERCRSTRSACLVFATIFYWVLLHYKYTIFLKRGRGNYDWFILIATEEAKI